jgi:rod shape-determining protein MreD
MNHALSRFFNVDLVVLLIAYLCVSRGETGAGVFAFCQGVLTDIFSGGFLGLFALIYLIVFFGIRIGSRPLDLLSSGGQVALVSLAFLLKGLLIIGFNDLFSLNGMFMFPDFLALLSSSVITGLVAPFLFSLLNYLDCFFVEGYEKS